MAAGMEIERQTIQTDSLFAQKYSSTITVLARTVDEETTDLLVLSESRESTPYDRTGVFYSDANIKLIK